MVRGFVRDRMRECMLENSFHGISFSQMTPEEKAGANRAYRDRIKKMNAERERKTKEYPALVQQGIITPLDTKYQERLRQQKENARIHAERMQRVREMRRQRRQESASSIVVEKSEELANRTSGASTEEQQQAIARAAANTLGFNP